MLIICLWFVKIEGWGRIRTCYLSILLATAYRLIQTFRRPAIKLVRSDVRCHGAVECLLTTVVHGARSHDDLVDVLIKLHQEVPSRALVVFLGEEADLFCVEVFCFHVYLCAVIISDLVRIGNNYFCFISICGESGPSTHLPMVRRKASARCSEVALHGCCSLLQMLYRNPA